MKLRWVRVSMKHATFLLGIDETEMRVIEAPPIARWTTEQGVDAQRVIDYYRGKRATLVDLGATTWE